MIGKLIGLMKFSIKFFVLEIMMGMSKYCIVIRLLLKVKYE